MYTATSVQSSCTLQLLSTVIVYIAIAVYCCHVHCNFCPLLSCRLQLMSTVSCNFYPVCPVYSPLQLLFIGVSCRLQLLSLVSCTLQLLSIVCHVHGNFCPLCVIKTHFCSFCLPSMKMYFSNFHLLWSWNTFLPTVILKMHFCNFCPLWWCKHISATFVYCHHENTFLFSHKNVSAPSSSHFFHSYPHLSCKLQFLSSHYENPFLQDSKHIKGSKEHYLLGQNISQ